MMLLLRRLLCRRRIGGLAAVVAAVLAAPGPSATAQSEPAFSDVPEGAYYYDAVNALAGDGVFSGTLCEEGFCPGEPIDRKTMAVWVVRVLDGADPLAVPQPRFDDIDAGSFHAPFVERMHQLKVTSGCGDGSGFCPHDNVTRAQMAVFVSRAFELGDGPDPDFADVPAGTWYAAEVAKLAASGITLGCGDGSGFCPHDDVTRAQMATFLWRGQNLGSPEGTQIARPPPRDTAEIAAAEDEMARMVNELRRSLGLAPLRVHEELRTVARAWSVTMRDRDVFEHNPSLTSYYPDGWLRAGENIAFYSASGRTLMEAVQAAFDGLVASPGHYANMTSPEFNSLGVGIALEGSSFWFTQDFAHYP